MKWLDTETACAQLGIKPASLYAYVSRGLVRARTGDHDPRNSLYASGDIDQLLVRKRAGRKRDSIARGAIGWGEPILESAIATVRDGRLIYRGYDAVALSQDKSLEEVASILWGEGGLSSVKFDQIDCVETDSKRAGFTYLAQMAASALPCVGRSRADLAVEATALLSGLSRAMSLGSGQSSAHEKLAALWCLTPQQGDIVRQALVLLADHELNPSTFAARVAASTGASLAACALAGYTTLTGPSHGQAASGALDYLDDAQQLGPNKAIANLRARFGDQYSLVGLGHKLYPDGDPRARALLAALKPDDWLSQAVTSAQEARSSAANIDMALAALTIQFALPRSAPFTLFAVARMAGWLAHGAEQGLAGSPIRPRARYVGKTSAK